MRKTFKYRLSPNKQTEQKLYWTLTRCRELYNAALSERKDAYKYAGKSISYYDQQNDLPEIKAEIREEYQDIAAHVLQDVLRRLNKAFDNFFRRCKNGENPGYPRFQGRNRYDSFTYPDGAGWKLTVEEQGKKLQGTLSLTKIGQAKVTLHRPLEGKIKTVTIKREVDQWFVTFSCEVEAPEKLPLSYEDIGIDLGVTHLATLSNGEMIEHPVRRIVGRKLSATNVVGTDGMFHAYSAYPTPRKRKATRACGEGHVGESHRFFEWSMQGVYGER